MRADKDAIRRVCASQITDAVAALCVEANISLGADIKNALIKAREAEQSELARFALDTLIKNAELAQRESLPICQDTGMAVVFLSIGRNAHIDGNVENAVNEGVRRGYREGYFRNSVVADPINRVNTNDNAPAVIYYDFYDGDAIKITVAPKGFGSENMSGVRMLKPSDGMSGIEDFIVETARSASASPCPPIIVGVGIGGTMEKAALLSKQALLRDIGEKNPDPFWADAEERLLTRLNALNIGPAGFGGATTALAVNILTFPTHIAGLPAAVNIGCNVTRHKTAVI